eukprot:sb/3472383/
MRGKVGVYVGIEDTSHHTPYTIVFGMSPIMKPKGSDKGGRKDHRGKGPYRNTSTQPKVHVAVGKHKWKALRDLKKARLDAGLYQETRSVVENKTKSDLVTIAQKKAVKAKEEGDQEGSVDKEEVKRLREEQNEKRKRNKKKMTAKTKRGQPVMKHQIGYLLHKIKNS